MVADVPVVTTISWPKRMNILKNTKCIVGCISLGWSNLTYSIAESFVYSQGVILSVLFCVSQTTTDWTTLRLCLDRMWPTGHYLELARSKPPIFYLGKKTITLWCFAVKMEDMPQTNLFSLDARENQRKCWCKYVEPSQPHWYWWKQSYHCFLQLL